MHFFREIARERIVALHFDKFGLVFIGIHYPFSIQWVTPHNLIQEKRRNNGIRN